MFNEQCRVALLAALHVRRHAPGAHAGAHVTWEVAELHWFYNEVPRWRLREPTI